MTKDELIKAAKDNFDVSLNPKDKLADLEQQFSSLESSVEVVEEVEVVKEGKDPIASKSEYGKIVPWNPRHREEHWEFIWKKSELSKEEKEKLGL
jgi:hypothetical protein